MNAPYQFLSADALVHGTDLTTWPRDRQLAAAIAAYKADPQLFADALGDLSADKLAGNVLTGLEWFQRDAFDGAQFITATLVAWLRDWPLDLLSERAEQWWSVWRDEADREMWIDEMERWRDAEREAVS